MANQRLTGQLSPENPSEESYDGHYIRLDFGREAAQEASIPYRASLSAPVEANGRFTLLVDQEVLDDASAILEVRSPLGTQLAGVALRELVEDDGLRTITVDPEPRFGIATHPDPRQGRPLRVTGRVLDRDGQRTVAGRQVLIFATPTAAEKTDTDAEPEPVLSARTDPKGYFSVPHPGGRFSTAFAEIAGARNPVQLEEDGRLPTRLVFAITLPPDEADSEDDAAVPRTPDEEDRLSSPESFSSDLEGRCVDFTAPNRTLEEFPFYKIVRTTDPEIKGTHLEPPLKIPPDFTPWLKKLAFGQETIDSKFQTRSGETIALGDVADRQVGFDEAPGEATEADGERRRPAPQDDERSETPTLTALEAHGVRGAAQWRAALGTRSVDSALKQSIPALSPESFRSVLTDADDFTPVSLMTAERLATQQLLKDLLRLHRHPTAGRAPLDRQNPIQWDAGATFYQATTIAHGHLLQFRQVWKADGYSLGDLLHSIPLAPCQKKSIVTIDWDRNEAATRTEDRSEREVLFANLIRDRDVQEVLDTALGEEIEGGSTAKVYGGGGGLGFAIGPLVIGVGGGGSGADSEAWQDASREISALTMNELKDRVDQSAAAVRSQRATVVQTLSQGERNRVESEVIANHNHCHAITVQHFEVLRHFQVCEELTEVRECLFVPFLMSRFHDAKVLRWRDVLRRSLLKRQLVTGLDAVERIRLNYTGVDFPSESFADDPLEALDGVLRVRLNIARPRDPEEDEADYFGNVWPFWPRLLGGNPADVYDRFLRNQQFKDRIFRDEMAPQIAEAFIAELRVVLIDEDGGEVPAQLDPALASKYRQGGIHTVTLADSGNTPAIARKEIVAIELRTDHELPEHSRVVVESANFTYHTRHLRHHLYRDSRVQDDLLHDDPVYLPTSDLTRTEERNPRAEDRGLRRRLLVHLNENLEYYHKAVWWSLDKERRFLLLDGFVAPGAGGRSVASVVENELTGIVGNALVFPVAAGFQLDPRYRRLREQAEPGQPVPDLLDLYAPLTPVLPRPLAIPTKGVFAEAVMGACNSCEKIDESRFWRFSDSPCPDEPPRIAEVSAGSRASAAPDLTATGFPAPIVNFQNVPEAPDPTGLGAALELIGRGDLFRDVTGLTQNQKNALQALQSSLATAQAFGQEAVQLAHAREAQRTIDRTLKNVEQEKKAGRLTGEAARAATKGALTALIGQQGKQGGSVLDSKSVQESLEAAAGAKKSSVSLKDESPGEQQTVEISQEGGPGPEGQAPVVTELDNSLTEFIDVPMVIDGLTGSDFKAKNSSHALKFLRESLIQKLSDGKYMNWLAVGMDGKVVQRNDKDSNRFQVKAEMQICYPADPADTKKLRKDPLAMRLYPVVVIVHGQHASWKALSDPATITPDAAASTSVRQVVKGKWAGQVENHKGYKSLQRFLAGHGIVSVSILTNLANMTDAWIRMRSETVLRSLDVLRTAAENDPDSRYFRQLDFNNVGLLGHSRGGDTVIDVLKLNQDPTRHSGRDPYGIKAVCALAPTDFTGTATGSGRLDVTAADGASLLVVYGSQDSDVDGTRLVGKTDFAGTGFRHYDRAEAMKAMVFITGATHNGFNTKWSADSRHITGTRLSDADHVLLANEYIGSLFRSVLLFDKKQQDLLTGRRPILGSSGSVISVAHQWRLGSRVKVVDEYDPSHLGDLHASADVELFAPFKPTNALETHISHHTKALKLPTQPGTKLFFVQNPGRDPLDYDDLLFRMAVIFDLTSVGAITPPKFPDFTITLEDDAMDNSSVTQVEVYAQNPLARNRPDRHEVDIAPLMTPRPASPVKHDVTKLFFETYRVKLSSFTGVDLHKLAEIRFDFAEPSTALDVYIDSIYLVKN